MEKYKLLIKASAAREMETLPHRKDRRRMVSRILALAENPRPPGCEKLSGYEDRYRIRQGPYRVVYSVDDQARAVTIFKVGHRKEVYR